MFTTDSSTERVAVAGPAEQLHARLVMHDGQRFCAQTHKGAFWIKVAAGCVMQPAVGDWVLVSLNAYSGYILCVLERSDTSRPTTITAPGTLHLQADCIQLHAAKQMHLTASATQMHFEYLALSGQSYLSRWQNQTELAEKKLTVATINEQYYGHSTKQVTGHEQTTATSYKQNVARDWSVYADSASILGTQRVRIDGAHLQLG